MSSHCCLLIQGRDVSESGATRVMHGPNSITLTIEMFSSSQKGSYQCIATNERGSRGGTSMIEGMHSKIEIEWQRALPVNFEIHCTIFYQAQRKIR